ncbi:hypothetical protein ACFLUW_00670 [Chloroflexota bacterium]
MFNKASRYQRLIEAFVDERHYHRHKMDVCQVIEAIPIISHEVTR